MTALKFKRNQKVLFITHDPRTGVEKTEGAKIIRYNGFPSFYDASKTIDYWAIKFDSGGGLSVPQASLRAL